MASAVILPSSGVVAVGNWGSRTASGVYYLADSATESVVDTVGSALAIAPPPGRLFAYPADLSSTRYLSLPPGDGSAGRTRAYWTQTNGASRFWTFAPPSESTSYRVSLYVTNGATARPLDVTVQSFDGSTTLVSTVTYSDSMPGVWVDIEATGSIRVLFGNTNFSRFQGVLYSPLTSSQAYSEPASAGLAIGGVWPPTLAILRDSWAGLDVGVGSGLLPSTTLVESAVGCLAIGDDWPPTLSTLLDAPAGLELLGGLGFSLGSDPTTLRAAFYSRLRASSALAAVVGSRVFHGKVPQRSDFPAVVFSAPSRSHGVNLSGGDGTSVASVSVDCWASNPGDAESAAEAVRLAFHGFRGWVGSVEFLSCLVDDVGDVCEPDAAGKDAYTFRHMISIDAKHRVSIPTFGA